MSSPAPFEPTLSEGEAAQNAPDSSFAQFCREAQEYTPDENSAAAWIHLCMQPDPLPVGKSVSDMAVWYTTELPKILRSFQDLISARRKDQDSAEVAALSTTTSEAIVLRHNTGYHLDKPATIYLGFDGRVRLTFPVETMDGSNLDRLRFARARQIIEKAISEETEAHGLFFDIGWIFASLWAHYIYFQDWLPPVPPRHLQKLALISSDLKEYVPVFDSDEWADAVVQSGLPAPLEGALAFPAEPGDGVYQSANDIYNGFGVLMRYLETLANSPDGSWMVATGRFSVGERL